ncbi:MAG: ATP synthase F1 subunit delta [Planctomycetota bacterium]
MPISDLTPQEARAAAEYQAEVGVAHIADVYAHALLGAAEKAGQTGIVLEEFDALVRDVVLPHPKFAEILGSELISHEDKLALLERVFGGRVSPLLLNFLKVVARHGRLDLLRAIHYQARLRYDTMNGRVRVRLTTATPVDPAFAGRIADMLRSALKAEPVVTHVTDPGLVGGAVLKIGDTVYDGSIANQLKTLRQRMMDRSAHEIQSRRDRFCAPAGD